MLVHQPFSVIEYAEDRPIVPTIFSVVRISLLPGGGLRIHARCDTACRSEAGLRPDSQPDGLTLVEVLVVLAIIAAVVGLLLPVVQVAREGSRRAACRNNLRQLGMAFHAHHDAVGTLPYTRFDRCETWAVLIMPFWEQSAAYGLWDRTKSYYQQTAAARTTVQAGLICPTRRGVDRAISTAGDVPQDVLAVGGTAAHVPGACSDYAVCTGDHAGLVDYYAGYKGLSATAAANGTFLYKNGQINFRQVSDGLTHTFLAGEKHVPNRDFGLGGNIDGSSYRDGSVYNGDYFLSCTAAAGAGLSLADGPAASSGEFGSYHPGLCPFVMGDGSVRSVSTSIEDANLARLANRNDGGRVAIDD